MQRVTTIFVRVGLCVFWAEWGLLLIGNKRYTLPPHLFSVFAPYLVDRKGWKGDEL